MNTQRKAAALILAAGLIGALAGCQSATAGEPVGPPQRPAVAVPDGIDLTRPADRIAEELERAAAAQAPPIVADRIEYALEREARERGFVDDCIRYVLVETPADWRVVCVQTP
jgi:hypothetical protein